MAVKNDVQFNVSDLLDFNKAGMLIGDILRISIKQNAVDGKISKEKFLQLAIESDFDDVREAKRFVKEVELSLKSF